MASHIFDGAGQQVGVVKSTEEIAAEYALIAAAGVCAVVAAPFVPILMAGYYTFQWLHDAAHWHALFAGAVGLLVVAVAILALLGSTVVRYLYFGAETLAATVFCFTYVTGRSDWIWGGFVALVVLAAGSVLTIWASSHEAFRS